MLPQRGEVCPPAQACSLGLPGLGRCSTMVPLYRSRCACCTTGQAPVSCADVPRSQVAAVVASRHCMVLPRALAHANCTARYGGRGQAGKPRAAQASALVGHFSGGRHPGR